MSVWLFSMLVQTRLCIAHLKLRIFHSTFQSDFSFVTYVCQFSCSSEMTSNFSNLPDAQRVELTEIATSIAYPGREISDTDVSFEMRGNQRIVNIWVDADRIMKVINEGIAASRTGGLSVNASIAR
uniref:Mechanosensitive ion channel family protein n=2 Tax=Mesocestoides corti TaxID=53468 RepID=A0A5K3G0K0_MESCO